jgi:ribosomal protein L2
MNYLNCAATVGKVSNRYHLNRVFLTAGRKRWLGIHPTVRGVAMNHAHNPQRRSYFLKQECN